LCLDLLLQTDDLFVQEFARQAEAIFRGSERRADLDKAYQKLVAAIFSEISRVANESQKTPREVVLFGESLLYLYIHCVQIKKVPLIFSQ